MALSLNTFKQALADGGARPSLFEMELTPPATLGINGGNVPNFRFYCRISEIPGATVNPITIKYGGREVKYAGNRTYANITVTLFNDENFSIRKLLERWIDIINDRATNRLGYPTSSITTTGGLGYLGTGTVKQLKKQGEVTRTYFFDDMFPVNLSNIALDWSNDGAIEDYTCEFAYQEWRAS